MFNELLDKAKELTEAINYAKDNDLWKADLTETQYLHVSAVRLDDIEDKLLDLKVAIATTEKLIYDTDARNHPVWRETQINPNHNRSNSPFEFIDGDYDLDAGWEDWQVYWESEDIKLFVRIAWTHDNGRDWGDVEVKNWKSEEDTIKWLRDRGVDVDEECSDDFLVDEAHGLHEIVQFNDGYLINEDKVHVS